MAVTTDELSSRTAQEKFETLGHVFVPDAYDPELVPGMLTEMAGIFRKYHLGLLGEQYASITTKDSFSAHPNLSAVLGSLGKVAAERLDCVLWPPAAGGKTRLTTHRMVPRTYGPWHPDDLKLLDAVAVTTPVGASTLTVKDRGIAPTVHELVPGAAVFLNNAKQLEHRGQAGNVNRVGLTVARL